jgi:hypothetical protein
MDNKEYYTKEEVIIWAIRQDAIKHIKEALQRYGIEGTEEKILDIYKHMPKLRDYLLCLYKEIIYGTR